MESPHNRRQFFRTCSVQLGAAIFAGVHLSKEQAQGQLPPSTQGRATQSIAPEDSFPESHILDTNWPALAPPSYPERCQITGVAVAKDGSIMALNHGENHADPAVGYLRQLIQKPAVLVIDPKTGKLLRAWGNNRFILPHHISVDAAGNVWIVDGVLKSVFKFDSNGNLLMELKGSDFDFQMPTDVAVFKDGSFLVADGAMNKRGVRFSADGTAMDDWGQRGEGLLQFHSPHALAVDDSGLVYVADRENRWIQVLNVEGECLATWTKVGRPACIRFHADSIWALSNFSATKGIVRRFNLDGKLQEAFHTKPAGAKGDFDWPHGLAVTDGGNTVYVGYILTSRQILRYRRKPTA